MFVVEVEEDARSGGSGKKLQEPDGRWDTRLKISVINRCCMVVSLRNISMCNARWGGRDVPAVYRTLSDVVDHYY